MEIYCKTCDKVLGYYPDEKIPPNVRGYTTCKLCGEQIEIFKKVEQSKAGKTMLKIFRMVSIIEGLSLIALMCIAIPAKYYFKYFDIVWDVGMAHGILWTIYFILSLVVSHLEKWKVTLWIAALFASVIPFASFLLERKLKKLIIPAKA
ncbi:MAG: DUF3817 domain-containing protein [Deltaproteobacteria bacterium]|nr:DUF3817 domain-containing protein [Deltaproteobacteria bacterium]